MDAFNEYARSWAAVLTVILTLIGSLIVVGVTYGQVQSHETRITKLESEYRQVLDQIRDDISQIRQDARESQTDIKYLKEMLERQVTDGR
jgi:uncharacterized protein (UPF0335 family)